MSSMLQWNHYRKDLIRFPKMYMLIVKRCKNIYLLIPESQYVINNIVRRLQFLSERVWSVWESRLAKNCFNNKSACLNSIYIYIYIYKGVFESRAMWQQYKCLSLLVCDGVMLPALTVLGMLEVRVHWITHADLI